MKYYKSVNLIKPRTSRFSNSEKYIVAIGFKGINDKEITQFNNVLKNWKRDKFCKTFGIDINTVGDIIPKIKDYNNFLVTNHNNVGLTIT